MGWTEGCSTTMVQQLEMPDRRTECMFMEQRTWQCPTIEADGSFVKKCEHKFVHYVGLCRDGPDSDEVNTQMVSGISKMWIILPSPPPPG